ncbi:MAG: hypothetical protein H0W88_11575 [Parachlamydiaceae bacterium]|nr:hypothetical protein [Parachlamydiaceae bacterium]
MNISRVSLTESFKNFGNQVIQVTKSQNLRYAVNVVALAVFVYCIYKCYKERLGLLFLFFIWRMSKDQHKLPKHITPIEQQAAPAQKETAPTPKEITFSTIENTPVDKLPVVAKPVLEGSLSGKITYAPDVIFSVEGKNIKLDSNGHLTGHGKVEYKDIVYVGDFEKTAFKNGLIKELKGGQLHQYEIKNGTCISAVRFKDTNPEILDEVFSGLDKQIELIGQNNLIIGPIFPTENYQFNGQFEGTATFPQKTMKLEITNFHLNEKGWLSGSGKTIHDDKTYPFNNSLFTYQ